MANVEEKFNVDPTKTRRYTISWAQNRYSIAGGHTTAISKVVGNPFAGG